MKPTIYLGPWDYVYNKAINRMVYVRYGLDNNNYGIVVQIIKEHSNMLWRYTVHGYEFILLSNAKKYCDNYCKDPTKSWRAVLVDNKNKFEKLRLLA